MTAAGESRGHVEELGSDFKDAVHRVSLVAEADTRCLQSG
jgi:hypothetical protein